MLRTRPAKGAAALAVVCLVALLQAGCASQSSRLLGKHKTPTKGMISKDELRSRLVDFAESARSRLDWAGAEIEAKSQTRRIEKTTIQLRVRFDQAVTAILAESDPITTFVELWSLTVRLRVFFESGEGAGFFGEYKYIAVGAMQDIERAIEAIGADFLDKDRLDATRAGVNEFAQSRPVTGMFSNLAVYATEEKPGAPNPFVSVLNIPMAPFRALEGVPETAVAISDFTATAERFSKIVSFLPESARWEMLLWLYDLEDTEMVASVLASMARFSESSAKLAEVADNLPQRLKAELSTLIEETDAKQENLHKTLAQAETTAASVTRALAKVSETAASLDAAARGVTETAHAWQSAAEATGRTATEIKNAFPPREKTESSFDMKELRDLAEEATKAAVEMRALTGEIRDLTEARRLSSLTGHVTWRAAEIVLLIFVLALLYRFLANRMKRSRTVTGGDGQKSPG